MLRPVKSVEFNSGLKICGPGLYIEFMRNRDRYPGFVKIYSNNMKMCVNQNYVRCIIEV